MLILFASDQGFAHTRFRIAVHFKSLMRFLTYAEKMARKIGDFIRAQHQYRERGIENFCKLQQDSHILKSSISSSSRARCLLPIRIDFVDERDRFKASQLQKKKMKISNKIVDRGTKFYLIFHLIFPPCKKFFSIRYLKFVNKEKLVFENYLIQVAIQVTLRRNSREKK